MNDVIYMYEKFEDTNGLIRSCKSKDRQCNGQMKKDKKTSNAIQKHYTDN